ncbi:MAG: hypothetical protein ACAH17_01600 [Candidatus Paceibacterota bacterium]
MSGDNYCALHEHSFVVKCIFCTFDEYMASGGGKPPDDRKLSERVRCKERFPQRGDEWALTVNHGTIYRWVKSVTRDGTVSYSDGLGRFMQCSWPTWRRWARSAEVTARDSWATEAAPAKAEEAQ